MKYLQKLKPALIILLALVPLCALTAFAQGSRRNPIETRRIINNDTWRELMKVDREARPEANPVVDKERLANIKQMKDDFKAIQEVNNKMMAEAWSHEQVDYARATLMIGDINEKATRLKDIMALPEAEKVPDPHLAASNNQEFKKALLVMDRSLMNFVNNPIFRERNVMEIGLAAQASTDLEKVIKLSSSLRKIAARLKNPTVDQ